MVTNLRIALCAFSLALCLYSGKALAIDCSGLPTQFNGKEFPKGDFFSNFNNPCYTIDLSRGQATGPHKGDRNSLYNLIYFKLNPRYELVVVGEFPNARYFSVTLNDDHSAYTESLLDANIAPLNSSYINPYQPGVPYKSGQKYAVAVSFGGTPGNQEKGCLMTGSNVNPMDATLRHTGMNWNLDPGFHQKFPQVANHQVDTPTHSNPNTGGSILVRSYLDVTPPGYTIGPHVIVRDVVSGCAYPAAYVYSTIQNLTAKGPLGNTWLQQDQITAHNYYTGHYLPQLCFGTDNRNQLPWVRSVEYVSGSNPDSSYIDAFPPANLPATLATSGEVIRMRFKLPKTPPTPCTDGCSRDGNEEMRYMSLSFEIQGGTVLASLADNAFVQDPNGYVTLIIGTGATIPSWISAANYYTYLDLTTLPQYQNLFEIEERNLLPSPGFMCAGQVAAYNMFMFTQAGVLMGQYVPVVDYPTASTLPTMASDLNGAGICDTFPKGDPTASNPNGPAQCGLNFPAPIMISKLVTQCDSPSCTGGIVAQPNPPINIVGAGFGSLPEGMPFTGTTPYLEIANNTQHWDAGFGTDTCTITVVSWATNLIQTVANLGPTCPLAQGDSLTITVTNPQTGKSTSATTQAN